MIIVCKKCLFLEHRVLDMLPSIRLTRSINVKHREEKVKQEGQSVYLKHYEVYCLRAIIK